MRQMHEAMNPSKTSIKIERKLRSAFSLTHFLRAKCIVGNTDLLHDRNQQILLLYE